MKFCVSWLICWVGLTGVPSVWAQTQRAPLMAEVLSVHFSPMPNAASAIVHAIDASEHEVLVQAYGFTHHGIAQALVRAHQRGVQVRVLLDQKSQDANRQVISLLSQAHVQVHQDGKHAIAHNKVMVIDQSIVITGSFNFTHSAATRNAENFLVLKSAELADQYRVQWLHHWAHAAD